MFCEILVDLLQKKDMTAYKLAKETGISQGLMSEYKKGIKLPSASNLTKIANALDVSVDTLLGKEASAPEPTESDAFADLFASLTPEDQMEIVRLMLEKKNKK